MDSTLNLELTRVSGPSNFFSSCMSPLQYATGNPAMKTKRISGVLGKAARLGTRRRGCGQAIALMALLIPAPSAPFATCPMLRIHQRGVLQQADQDLAARRPAGGGEGNVERGLREVCAPHPGSPDGDGTGHKAKLQQRVHVIAQGDAVCLTAAKHRCAGSRDAADGAATHCHLRLRWRECCQAVGAPSRLRDRPLLLVRHSLYCLSALLLLRHSPT